MNSLDLFYPSSISRRHGALAIFIPVLWGLANVSMVSPSSSPVWSITFPVSNHMLTWSVRVLSQWYIWQYGQFLCYPVCLALRAGFIIPLCRPLLMFSAHPIFFCHAHNIEQSVAASQSCEACCPGLCHYWPKHTCCTTSYSYCTLVK